MISLFRLPTKSTLLHLRIPFSFFLLPIPLLALAETPKGNIQQWFILVGILSLGIFPASNAYNSFYDRDEFSIGGLEKPPPVGKDLLFWSLMFEGFALLAALLFLGIPFFLLLFTYGVISKLYSHPGVRWKAKPWAGWLSVVIFQGAVIYCTCRLALLAGTLLPGRDVLNPDSLAVFFLQPRAVLGAMVSALLVGASYPLTQIYQHQEDESRGDLTLSRKLGIRGTFIFAFSLLALALPLLALQFDFSFKFLFVAVTSLPGFVFLLFWMRRSWNDFRMANFTNAHRFLILSSLGGIVGFLMAFAASAASSKEVLVEQGLSSVKALDGTAWFQLSKYVRREKGAEVYRVIFEDSAGKILSEEKIDYQDGKVQTYHWKSRQTEEEAEISLLGNKLKYRYASKGFQSGKTKESSDELDATEVQQLVMPPMVSQYILTHWEPLMAGKKVELRIAAPDLRTTFTFTLSKEALTLGKEAFTLGKEDRGDTSEKSLENILKNSLDKQVVQINLRANNPFVRMKLGVIPFIFDGNKNLLAVRNVLPPVRWQNKNLRLEEKTSHWISSQTF